MSRFRSLLHPLIGTRPGPLLRTLRRHGGIDANRIPVVLVALLIGVLRWPNCAAEAARTRRAGNLTLSPPPVFIVGHWRSGTTLLHHILSRDPAFGFPRLIDVLSPYEFFPSPLERFTHPLIFGLLPPTRPMDDVPLAPDLPQEEELALAAMAAPSFFNCLYFPARFDQVFHSEVLLQSPAGAALRPQWQAAYRHYLGKLALRYPDKRLLLKNPANSARVMILKEMFPGAKFVHIHRHPHDVFASMTKFYQRMLPAVALRPYEAARIPEHVLDGYPPLMTALLDACETLAADQLVAVSFADLVRDPTETVARIYRQLAIPLTAAAIEGMRDFLARTPVVAPPPARLPDQAAERIRDAWGPVCRRLGYS